MEPGAKCVGGFQADVAAAKADACEFVDNGAVDRQRHMIAFGPDNARHRRVIKAGGSVVKNVAGYDLTKLQVGGFGAFGVLTLYAFVSRRDFSAWGSFFMVGLWVLLGTMFLNFFFRNPAMDLWLAGITVLVFSGLLVFDTWRIRNVFGPDEYVGAAVTIYLDLLNLFLGILRVLGGRRS